MVLQIGSLVKLEGLVSASQYNGMVAIVVKAKDQETGRWGVQLLDHASGWEQDKTKRCGGKQIAAKESNFSLSERDSEIWRNQAIRQGGDGISVWEFILQSPQIAGEDYCDKVCMKIWESLAEPVPSSPLTIDHDMNFRKELLSTTGHKIYWLELEAVQHHLIIEKCGGRYRVFQSYIQDGLESSGYTAGEWCTLYSLPTNKTHKKYGGGLTLGDTEINEYLDTIVELQKVTKALIRPLLKDIHVVDSSSIDLLTRDNPKKLPPAEIEKASRALEVLLEWRDEVLRNVGPLGISTIDETADPVVVFQGFQLLFKISQKHYRRVHHLNEKLTGEARDLLNPVIFVKMIYPGIWWEWQKDPRDGGAIGFTVRGGVFPV